MQTFARIVFFAALLAPPAALRAQCQSVQAGCPGALPVACGGSAQIGQALKFGCPNNGRATSQLLLAGLCAPTPWALPAGVGCVTGCTVAVGGSMIAIPTGFTSVAFPVPNSRSLIGLQVCFQCADIVPFRQSCVALSEGAMVTIQ